ncbi:MAG: CPBP family intramembrane metalloprotease [Anaerolineales bacterium]|nr:CPBP family intramembrane metalloprotease [Anaerolineales bacterium]
MPKNLNNQQKDSLIPFFLLTFLITWGLGALAIFLPVQFQALVGELTETSPIYFLAIAAPTISATILTFARDGLQGLKSLYARLIRWRFDLKWYALVLLGIPVVGWIAARITGASPLKPANTPSEFLWLLLYLLITGPLCEELGWRGFALPRLLDRFTPFTASLILGAIWGVWHLPSFFLSGMVQAGLSLPFFLLNAVLLSIFVTWVFQHTDGSVLITVLIHFTVNICASIIGVAVPVFVALLLTVDILILVFDKRFGWFSSSDLDRQIIPIGATK